jgi:hypothetical protein
VISFRYHLVSLVAVFLALALGIVVGTTALNGPITKDLRHQVNDLKDQRDSLTAQVKQLHGQVDDAGKFAAMYGSKLIENTLAGKDVLEIILPGASGDMADGLSAEISAAGGKVSGRITITPAYLDPSGGTGIVELATGAAHPVGWTAPPTSNADELGGSLLAYVLLGHGQSTDLTQVLGGFAGLHMVSSNGEDITPSTTVVVLARGGLRAHDYAGTAEESLVSQLAAQDGHVVVAGDAASAGKDGLIAQVRASKEDRAAVSTVDNANNPFGQVSTVLALASAIGGQVGHYGTDQSADALFPAPSK